MYIDTCPLHHYPNKSTDQAIEILRSLTITPHIY